MKKNLKNSCICLRGLLRCCVLALVIDANLCERIVTTSSSINPRSEGPSISPVGLSSEGDSAPVSKSPRMTSPTLHSPTSASLSAILSKSSTEISPTLSFPTKASRTALLSKSSAMMSPPRPIPTSMSLTALLSKSSIKISSTAPSSTKSFTSIAPSTPMPSGLSLTTFLFSSSTMVFPTTSLPTIEFLNTHFPNSSPSMSLPNSSMGQSTADTPLWRWQLTWNWVAICQFIISSIGVIGNLLVVLVMRVRRSATNSTDIFIGGLAISDLLTSICNMPYPKALQVSDSFLGVLYCLVIYTEYVTWMCIISSTYILVGTSFERLMAVLYPLRFKEIFTNRRVYVFIIASWLFAFISCSYFLILSITHNFGNNCVLSASDPFKVQLAIGWFNFTIRLLIPCALLMISQIATAISLHRKSKQLGGVRRHGANRSYHVVARDRIIKTMLVVVIIFVLCWAPSQITWIVFTYRKSAKSYFKGTLHQILTLITFLNSAINPFIYAANYPKFRSAIKDIFMGTIQKNTPLFGMDKKTPNQSDQNTKP